jgi:hypothetical protein
MKLIYSDTRSLAYEKNGIRYSIIYKGGRVQVTEMLKDGSVSDYMLDLDDAIVALRSSLEADYAERFLRTLKRKLAARGLWQSVKVIFKLTVHMLIAAVFAFAAGYMLGAWRR